MRNNRGLHLIIGFSLICFAATSAFGEETAKALSLIPKPVKLEPRKGAFVVTANTRILVEKDSPEAAKAGKQLAGLLNRATGFELKTAETDDAQPGKGAILLTRREAKSELGNEGYELAVSPGSIVIRAPKGAGLFYGVQTVRQLLPPEIESRSPVAQEIAWAIPCVQIEDQPRFEWRGLLVDSARHFFPMDSLKRFLDLMALHKLNMLQIHFTDDQSWTLQIDSCPKLTSVGSHGGPFAMDTTWLGLGKGIGSGRYYTKDDIRELVAYAADRHITLVPEIEMPAHAGSWLAAHPELLCTSHAKFPEPKIGPATLQPQRPPDPLHSRTLAVPAPTIQPEKRREDRHRRISPPLRTTRVADLECGGSTPPSFAPA